MKRFMFFLLMIFLSAPVTLGASGKISEDTEACLECHASAHPGIVADWEKSRMTKITPAEALKKTERERRISVKKVASELSGNIVGCAECHTMNPEKHRDTFDHEGYQVHTVVTPQDCATCHPVEAGQYSKNIMSHAHLNLNNNPVYLNLMETINGEQSFEDGKITYKKSDAKTNADSCNHCHGTKVEVQGVKARDTDFGELEFPVLKGWPNQGVGRINPDKSLDHVPPATPDTIFLLKWRENPTPAPNVTRALMYQHIRYIKSVNMEMFFHLLARNGNLIPSPG